MSFSRSKYYVNIHLSLGYKNTCNTYNYTSYFKINQGVYLTFILKWRKCVLLEVNASHNSRPTTPNVKMIAIIIYFYYLWRVFV